MGKWANRGAGHGAGALRREGYANVVDILGPPELKGGKSGGCHCRHWPGPSRGVPPCSRHSPGERRPPPARGGGGAAGSGSTDGPYP